MKPRPKILFLDIETRPALAYVWRTRDENIGVDQVVDPGGMICFAAKFLGKKRIYFFSDWQHGHKRVVEEIHKLLGEADAVVTYNGDRFDLPKLQGEFLLNGLKPPPPPTSIDAYKTIKKMGFLINRLEYIGPFLKVGEKIKNEGFRLWRGVIEGDHGCRMRMKKYNIQDTLLLEDLYIRIRAFIKDHPHLGEKGEAGVCGACGSHHLQSRGYRRTKAYRIQRVQCQSCGAWSTGKREKL